MTSPLMNMLKQETISQPQQQQQGPIKGTGGGLADSIPAVIEGAQPAALSEGEFIFPADVVSMLGDGSSEAGSRILNRFIESIRSAKQGGETKQAKSITESLGV
jgi:hypothetical protein